MPQNVTVNGHSYVIPVTSECTTDAERAMVTAFLDAAANETVDSTQLQVSLVAAAENTNVITVTGAILDFSGDPVDAAKDILITTLAVTADKGDITNGGTGTFNKVVNPSTGANLAWVTTDATGNFVFTVTDSAAESVLITVQCPGAPNATKVVTFT